MVAVIEQLARDFRAFAPELVVSPKGIYRIYRDTRFSKDKTPYKTHIGAIFPREGMEKHGSAGYYFSVGADGIEFASNAVTVRGGNQVDAVAAMSGQTPAISAPPQQSTGN